MEDPDTDAAPGWADLKKRAQLAESVGFDTIWVADELQWESEGWDGARNWWECVAIIGGIAAVTDRIEVGTWVLSALHRNPGLTARAAEAIDEISGGRFIFGLGSGHAGRQGAAFGFPSNYTVSRYEEALAVITQLRDSGRSTFEGEYHQTKDQVLGPRSSGGREIPLMLGGHGPRTMRLAVDNADIWSAYATESSQPEAFADMVKQLNDICEVAGRDPASLGRSIGIAVAAPGKEPSGWLGGEGTVQGSAEQIIDTFGRFAEMGCSRLEVMAAGGQEETIEGLSPVVEAFK
jgi:alkanesulfonate monooxygenase SsuD/methylene tetrahydromethanopterin reductase-like flavin-dependent oxidoreductase (luciferase family)